jgi:LmbE family N-acetylglucosaminyl deacetylase
VNILCTAAHPDDEVLGCGGTLARAVREGHSVQIAVLGEGITSRHARREDADPSALKFLRQAAEAATATLGAKEVVLLGLPDNRFDSLPLLEIVRRVEGLIAKFRPEVIYTHSAADLNIDHIVTNRAVVTATRPVPGCSVREVLAFEVPSSTDWGFQQTLNSFRPSVFVDISETLETKLTAMQCYAGEMRPFPHPRSREALTALAQWRGSIAGFPAAEAFELVRRIHPEVGTVRT